MGRRPINCAGHASTKLCARVRLIHERPVSLTDTPNSFDVVVIGAGVFGAWTAYQLSRDGLRVLLIDAYGAGNSRSSSGDESRIIRMGYGGDEIYTRSAQRSLQLWKQFCTENDEGVFRCTGVLWLAHDDDSYAVKTKETLTRAGIQFETLSVDEARQRYPQIGLTDISWAMLEPESGVLLARAAVQVVVRAAVRRGAEYIVDAVLPVSANKFDCVETVNRRRLSANAYVFACGPWLPRLFPELLGDRIQPTRQEVFYFGPPTGDSIFAPPALPTWIDFKEEAYSLPNLGGRGVKVAIDRHGLAFDPDKSDRLVTAEGLAEVRRLLARRLPAMKDAPVTESRVCQYENTSNGDFLIDRHPDFANVWLVGGGSGHGFKHGPMVGEYVANAIAGRLENPEPRFGLQSKRRTRQRLVY